MSFRQGLKFCCCCVCCYCLDLDETSNSKTELIQFCNKKLMKILTGVRAEGLRVVRTEFSVN